MPRYYFNLRDDLSVDDEDGLELPDIKAAHAHAIREARHMAGVSVEGDGKLDLRHRIEVADESGQVVLTVEFGDVVTVVRNLR